LRARARRRPGRRRDVRLIPIRPAAAVLAFALVFVSPPRSPEARTLARVTLPDSVTVDAAVLRLNGMALYEKFTFDVLVAGLYLERPERSAERVLAADAPRRYVSRF